MSVVFGTFTAAGKQWIINGNESINITEAIMKQPDNNNINSIKKILETNKNKYILFKLKKPTKEIEKIEEHTENNDGYSNDVTDYYYIDKNNNKYYYYNFARDNWANTYFQILYGVQLAKNTSIEEYYYIGKVIENNKYLSIQTFNGNILSLDNIVQNIEIKELEDNLVFSKDVSYKLFTPLALNVIKTIDDITFSKDETAININKQQVNNDIISTNKIPIKSIMHVLIPVDALEHSVNIRKVNRNRLVASKGVKSKRKRRNTNNKTRRY